MLFSSSFLARHNEFSNNPISRRISIKLGWVATIIFPFTFLKFSTFMLIIRIKIKNPVKNFHNLCIILAKKLSFFVIFQKNTPDRQKYKTKD